MTSFDPLHDECIFWERYLLQSLLQNMNEIFLLKVLSHEKVHSTLTTLLCRNSYITVLQRNVIIIIKTRIAQ